MEALTLFILPALAGVGIGILSGLLGVGGGTVMVPIFRLVFGMSPVMSTATSLFAIIPTSVSGAVSHVPALGVAAGLGGAVTSPVGVWLAQISPPWLVMAAAALIFGWSAAKMLGKAIKMKKPQAARNAGQAARNAGKAVSDAGDRGESPTKGAVACAEGRELQGPPSEATAASNSSVARQNGKAKLTRKQLLIGVGIGLIAGLASGYVGVGGGFIMVPLMLSLVGIAMRQASGTSLIAVMILAVPGVIEQALLGNINYAAGIAVVVGTVPGAVVGARLVRVVPERTLRFIFGGFLLVAAALLLVNEFGIL